MQNAELVREYVKDWAWEGRKINVNDQIYFLGKQVRRETMLYGKLAEGRYQTESEAKQIDVGVKSMLLDLKVPFVEGNVGDDGLKELLKYIQAIHDRPRAI